MILRPADSGDRPVLFEALYEAFNWRGTESFTREQLRADANATHYLEGWQRDTDFGIVAVADDGETVGVAWCRLFDEEDPGYGFVAAGVPELSIAVFPGHRGQGVGRQLLEAVLRAARFADHAAVSLSVEDGNAARRLYESLGFATVGRNGNSDTMVVATAAGPVSTAR
jgi:ribosomal protein S18 acetylase RimI-like enzyme